MFHFRKILIVFFIASSMNLSINAQSPLLIYSTIIGGSGWDYGHGITVDRDGYVYIAGQANSSNYPTTEGTFDRTHNGGSDIFISKLNQTGSALVYSTYIGGSVRDDTRKIFVDGAGCVYITGATTSPDFSFVPNCLAGNSEGYFLKLNSTGDSLLYLSRWAGGEKLLLDSDGNLVILGSTTSANFITTENAYCRTYSGDQDIFVAKINLSTNEVIFSTLIGGTGSDWAPSMAIDKENNIIIAGRTNSENYPVKGNTFGNPDTGKYSIVVSKLKSDGSELLYSTIIGADSNCWAFDVACDENNDVYVTGVTRSGGFPVSYGAFDTSYNEGDDAILMKLSFDGSRIIYATYIGGNLKDGGRGIVVDKNGRAYLTGCTRSTNFPVTDNAFDKTFNGAGTDSWAWGDPFLLVINPEGTQIEYSTYFGGSSDEEAYGIAMDTKGDIYICGVTSSNNFPTTEGAYDRSKNGSINVYTAKFTFNIETGVKTGGIVPSGLILNQNYPNPFNPSTIITYQLKESGRVKLIIYNSLGLEINTLIDSFQSPGTHSVVWNGTNYENNSVSSGVYFYSLLSIDKNTQKKMILIR